MSGLPGSFDLRSRLARRTVIACTIFLFSTINAQSEQLTVDMVGNRHSRAPASSIHLSVDRVQPGGVVTVFAQKGIEGVTLEDERGVRVVRAAPVTVRAGAIAQVTAFLLPVDSTVTPGEYRVVATDGTTPHAKPLTVAPRAFLSREIALNRRLSLLRSVPDPEKTRQTIELSNLVLSADPDAVHHLGPLSWPLPRDTRETSGFGVRRRFLYADGTSAQTIHVGIDLAAPTGSVVRSTGAGVVRMAKNRIVTGGTVVIEHLPGVYSLYYHLHSVDTNAGQQVHSGDTIGTVGATGLATGAHLHWEIRVGGVPVDPESLIANSALQVDFRADF